MQPQTSPPQRLNKVLAQQLGIGRRAADILVSNNKVTVNGKPANLGQRISPNDILQVQGKPLQQLATTHLYILMNKPTGYVCSHRQQGTTPTIYNLLPKEQHHLKIVGRLDKDSSGLLLLTNNGDMAYQLTHPQFKKIKKYEVTIDKPLPPLHRQMIHEHGILLPDGPSKLHLERLQDNNDTQWIVTMHQGKNRQIRRTFAALGYKVTALKRTQLGPFTLAQLHGKPTARVSP